MTKKARPRFGQPVRARDRLVRTTGDHKDGGQERRWVRSGERFPGLIAPKPVSGLYIGYRTLKNGRRYYYSYDEGPMFQPQEHFEAWGIVPSERSRIVYVLPEDCEWDPEEV